MIAACHQHGKFPGMAGVYNAAIPPRSIAIGARFIPAGQDALFPVAGATRRTACMRQTFSGNG